MMTDLTPSNPDQNLETNSQDQLKPLSPAAQRALTEAAERRRQVDQKAQPEPSEVGGRGGLDPVRYGDWEKGGLTSDF